MRQGFFVVSKSLAPFFFATLLVGMGAGSALAALGHLELRIVDEDTGEPIAALLELRDSKGRIRRVRPSTTVDTRMVVDGVVVLKLPPGNYQFKITRGPEYPAQSGNFIIESAARDNHTVTMKRFVDLNSIGWRSLHVAIKAKPHVSELLGRAADVRVTLGSAHASENFAAWKERCSATNERLLDLRGEFAPGGQLALLGSSAPKPTAESARLPTATDLLQRSRDEKWALCVAMDAAAEDLPMWVASRALDAVNVIPSSEPARRGLETAEIFKRDEDLYPGKRGQVRWREYIYFQLLESGLKIAPVAFEFRTRAHSAADARTYALVPPTDRIGEEFSDVLIPTIESGNVMLSAGPLMIAKFNGQPAGSTFEGFESETVEVRPTLTLHTQQKISYLELVKNGKVFEQIRLEDWVEKRGVLPAVPFDKSGWMLVRAVVDDDSDYRFASTGPVYIEFDSEPRMTKDATRFFLDWAERRSEAAAADERFHNAAVRFWTERHESSR